MFGQKRLSREGGIEIVVKELCTRMARDGCQVAKKVYAVNDACYYYDLRFGSLTQKYRESLPKQYVNLYRSYMKFIEN